MAVDQDRERLRDLSAGLVRLHALLLDRERRAYEERHGAVGSWELLQLLLHDEQFAWLRSLSSLMAQIDALVDTDEPVAAADAQGSCARRTGCSAPAIAAPSRTSTAPRCRIRRTS